MTRGPPYDYHRIIPLGLDQGGNEVALEVILKTYDTPDMKTTTCAVHQGPWTRACFVALVKGDVPVLGRPRNQDAADWVDWIKQTFYGWRERWVKWNWMVDMLQAWEDWHLNDLRLGTEDQEKALAGFRESNATATLEETKDYLKTKGLLVDRAHEYGGALFDYMPWLLRVLDKKAADAIIDLAEEGLDQSN